MSDADSLVLLREFVSETEAYILKNLLESSDIPSYLFNTNLNSALGFGYANLFPVRLMVRQGDYERALLVFNELKSPEN